MTHEPTNVPCRRCGAPLREDGDSHLAASVTMRCAHCGETEPLPRDTAERVLAVRALRAERRWAEDAAQGPAIAYLRIMERGGMFVAPYLFAAVIAVVSVATVPRTMYTLLPIGVIGGAACATYVAFRMSRARLRATLTPLIRAFPGPPGRPARCRRCGGELPQGASAFVACAYCDAPNLTFVAATEHIVVRDEARLYAHETAAEVARAGAFVSRAFTVAFVIGAASGGALAIALR